MAIIPEVIKKNEPIEKMDIKELSVNLSKLVEYNKFISDSLKQITYKGMKKAIPVEVQGDIGKSQVEAIKEQTEIIKEEGKKTEEREKKKPSSKA